jgi:hypothetical protein
VYSLNIAKMFEATVVFDDTTYFYTSGGHNSTDYFFIMSEVLGINLTLTTKSLALFNGSSAPRRLSFYEAQNLANDIKSGKSQLPCRSIISSDIQSCSGHWCPTESSYEFVESVKWHLRRNNANETCAKLNFGFKSSHVVNVLWHFRNGDICLHCREVEYVRKIYDGVLQILELTDSDVGNRIEFSLKSSNQLVEYQHAYPRFKYSTESVPLVETICQMLTSDILISSGSSLIIVGAFFPVRHPVIFEEQRKNLHNENFRQFHILPAFDAVRMFNGEFTIPFIEVKSIVLSTLQEKLAVESPANASVNTSGTFPQTSASSFSTLDMECRLIRTMDNNMFYFIMYGFKLWIKDMTTLSILNFVEEDAINSNSSFLKSIPGSTIVECSEKFLSSVNVNKFLYLYIRRRSSGSYEQKISVNFTNGPSLRNGKLGIS